jgi:hypothetical protein
MTGTKSKFRLAFRFRLDSVPATGRNFSGILNLVSKSFLVTPIFTYVFEMILSYNSCFILYKKMLEMQFYTSCAYKSAQITEQHQAIGRPLKVATFRSQSSSPYSHSLGVRLKSPAIGHSCKTPIICWSRFL